MADSLPSAPAPLLSLDDCAARLGISPAAVARLLTSGGLRAEQDGHGAFLGVTARELDHYRCAARQRATEAADALGALSESLGIHF